MYRVIEQCFEQLLLDAEPPFESAEELSRWLVARSVPPAGRVALADQGPQALLRYRQLARQTLSGAVQRILPRATARLGDDFEPEFGAVLERYPPSTAFLRDVAGDFVRHAEGGWSVASTSRVPNYIAELARYELTHIELSGEQDGSPAIVSQELALERGVVFARAVRLLPFDHAIHELSDDIDAHSAPEHRPTTLLVYRDPKHEIRYLSVSPLVASLVALLREGVALESALKQAFEKHEQLRTAENLQHTAGLLADFAERGIIVGSA